MTKQAINTANAPAAIGTYSQAVRYGNLVFLSGQIPLDPATMQLVEGDFAAQAHQVFNRLVTVCRQNHVQGVETGRFGAHMVISLVNDGPVTFLLRA